MAFLDGVLGGASKTTGGVGASASAGAKGGGLGSYSELISIGATAIVQYAFASSIKKDQKRLEKELAKLDAKKQAELLSKVQQAQTEIQRQEIVFQYIDKGRIEELKKQDNAKKTYIYVAIGFGLLLYGLVLLKIKKK